MLDQLKDQPQRIAQIAERRGLRKLVQEVMEEPDITESLSDSMFEAMSPSASRSMLTARGRARPTRFTPWMPKAKNRLWAWGGVEVRA